MAGVPKGWAKMLPHGGESVPVLLAGFGEVDLGEAVPAVEQFGIALRKAAERVDLAIRALLGEDLRPSSDWDED